MVSESRFSGEELAAVGCDSEEQGETKWGELPESLFESFVNVLSWRDVRNIRLVCKWWCGCCSRTLHRLEPGAAQLPKIVEKFPSLHVLGLKSIAEKFEVDLGPLTKLSRLHSLNLQGDIPMSAKGVVTIHGLKKLRKLESLVNLRLSCFQIGENDTLRSVGLLGNLRTLSLCGSKEVTDTRLAAITRLSRLEKLNMSGCDRVTSDGILLLKSLSNLTALDISFCRCIDDRIGEALTELPHLAYLDLSACWMMTDVGLAPVERMTNIRVLKVSSCWQITDSGLVVLQSLRRLEVLDLSVCAEVGDVGLKMLDACTNLRLLDISHCVKITDEGLKALKKLKCLAVLNISNCDQVTDGGLEAVASLACLCKLDVGGCSNVTDNGVSRLTALARLRDLLLSDCQKVTGASLLELAEKCENLRELHIKGCNLVSMDSICTLERSGATRVRHSGSKDNPGDGEETTGMADASMSVMNTGGA